MSPEIQTYLFDILKAITEIESFFEGSAKTFSFFQNDIRIKRASERNLEIIGEAAGRILKKDPAVSLPNMRKIIDTRNRIIHGYDSVSDEILWTIISDYLPELKESVQALLPG